VAVRYSYCPNPSFEDTASPPTAPTGWNVLSGSGTGFFWHDTSNKHQTVANSSAQSETMNCGSTAGTKGLITDPITLLAGKYTASMWAQVQNMWRIERELSNGKTEVDWQHMCVSPDWEDEYSEKYREAMRLLNNCCDELTDSLSDLFRLMHHLGIEPEREPQSTLPMVDQDQPA
jgi:hypothetical protein